MSINEKPVLGIILGDHAGSSPEMAAKAVLAGLEAIFLCSRETWNVLRSLAKM